MDGSTVLPKGPFVFQRDDSGIRPPSASSKLRRRTSAQRMARLIGIAGLTVTLIISVLFAVIIILIPSPCAPPNPVVGFWAAVMKLEGKSEGRFLTDPFKGCKTSQECHESHCLGFGCPFDQRQRSKAYQFSVLLQKMGEDDLFKSPEKFFELKLRGYDNSTYFQLLLVYPNITNSASDTDILELKVTTQRGHDCLASTLKAPKAAKKMRLDVQLLPHNEYDNTREEHVKASVNITIDDHTVGIFTGTGCYPIPIEALSWTGDAGNVTEVKGQECGYKEKGPYKMLIFDCDQTSA